MVRDETAKQAIHQAMHKDQLIERSYLVQVINRCRQIECFHDSLLVQGRSLFTLAIIQASCYASGSSHAASPGL
jgi:hypothetical protein